jgi:chromate transporter
LTILFFKVIYNKKNFSLYKGEQMKELVELFLAFARIGGLTFGGGYAMLPMLQREAVEKKGWVTEEELMDYYAVGQCIPGVIAVNTAVFIGTKAKGLAGAIAASLGVISPSIVIIVAIAAFIQSFSELPIVQNAFAGIRVGVCVLILSAVLKLFKKAIIDKFTFGLFAVVFALSIFTDISPILFVILAAIAGIAVHVFFLKGGKAK